MEFIPIIQDDDNIDYQLDEKLKLHRGSKRNVDGNKRRTISEIDMKIAAKMKERQSAMEQAVGKYHRDDGISKTKLKKMKNKRLRSDLEKINRQQKEASESAARAEILLTASEGFLEPENEMEKTYKFSQRHIKDAVDMNTRAKILDLKLETFAPYHIRWTKNGRHMIMGGRKGHVSVIDALRNEPQSEIIVKETVRDVTFLHNNTMCAVAQKKYIFIYDEHGSEVHRLRSHIQPERLEFLPYHFLLASVGHGGWLKYQDTSTGDLVSEHRTKLGPCDTMCQNPWNAVICLGHQNGTVSMWSPAVNKPLVKMFCHTSPVCNVRVDLTGNYMATAGLDGKVSIWDVRTYKKMHSYHSPKPPLSMDISQSGLLAIGTGYQVQIWKDALAMKQQSPYMKHARPGDEICSVRFRPFEDILGLGHSSGVETIVIPGAGKANYDAFEANPFENTRQRRETEVHSLLEKIQPGMISLNPNEIGLVDTASDEVKERERQEAEAERKANMLPEKKKNKMRGKNKIGRRLRAKNMNIITAEKEKYREMMNRENQGAEKASEDQPKSVLFKRFR